MTEKIITSTIREQVYEILKQRIIDGYYKGGERLTDQEISEEFRVSRSPVREAFRLLQSDELLIGTSNRSLIVRTYTKKDVCSLYQVEIMMQNSGIELITGRITEEQKNTLLTISREFEKYYLANDFDGYLHTSEKFHRSIVEFCNNNILNGMYRRIGLLNHRFRRISLENELRFKNSYEEHQSIIQNILNDNLLQAKKEMMRHLKNACLVIMDQLPKEQENFECKVPVSLSD